MVRKVSNQIKSLLSRPKASMFFMFLVISFFIWFLITLSDTYVSRLNFSVSYSGIPEEKLVLGSPTSSFEATVQATGFKILTYRLFRQNVELPYADFRKQNDSIYMLSADVESAINRQHKSLMVRRLDLDSLKLTLGENIKKYVPVVPRLFFSFEEDFDISDSIQVIPDSIWVRGPEDIVAKVDRVHTIVKNYKNVHNSIDGAIALQIPDSLHNLEYETEQVTIKAQVERFSEKIIALEVQVKNLPENTSIKLYPPKVEILCKAPISQLKNIRASDFVVVCDFKDANDEVSYLIPQIIEKPSFVSGVKLIDQKIEFLTKIKQQ
ncbi:CdaR family protein [Galbibacter sp.]|jgi:YbbR domain-containing protein|uniref:CdaR family protein n=1 Tax=Galbibacter sp. TaxID=2918471 RepID=UPI003A946AA7